VQLDVVEREPTKVMFVAAPGDPVDDPEPARAAFLRLETVVGLRGRKFFGVHLDDVDEYRACVAVRDGDDADELGLAAWTIPSGRYLRGRIRGEPPDVYDRIGPGSRSWSAPDGATWRDRRSSSTGASTRSICSFP
jgi:hypothetical protein